MPGYSYTTDSTARVGPRRRAVGRLALAVTVAVLAVGATARAETTIAVLNFANTDIGADARHGWLSKALADLMINDLSHYRQLRVVTREHMQMLLREASLFDKHVNEMSDASRRRLRKHLRVDYLVFGAYTVRGGEVTIRALLIRLRSGKVLATFSETCPLKGVLTAEKALAAKVIGYFRFGGSAAAVVRELPRWTDSIRAAQRLYEGIDHFDQGRFAEAWYAFRQALVSDPNYPDPHYWLARMSYYRQEYEHARIEYERFVLGQPSHPRVGDAIMEYVHSFERLSDSPQDMLELYQGLRRRQWRDVRVHNQVDYSFTSPLPDWLDKRRQQALRYQYRFEEAFDLLAKGVDDGQYDSPDPYHRTWRQESMRLMGGLAQINEDLFGKRLASPHLPFRDIYLSKDDPTAGEDLRGYNLKGRGYLWGPSSRVLAPEGFRIKKVVARIKRTDDRNANAVCRLQFRRYRYVDIHNCWTEELYPKERVFQVYMPPGCTWFYLRPEYYGERPNPFGSTRSRFDSWSMKAELAPLEPTGGVDVQVTNATRFHAYVDGRYGRCYSG
ncbi:hypothetical protein LCGC14_2266340, partial [marine sediment metagenome]